MYVVITNPYAGNGAALRQLEAIQKDPLFTSKNCRSFQTEYEGHARILSESIVRTHHSTIDAVVIIGGDGTVHEVMNGLAAWPDVPVGIIPAGSGNDFVRGLGIQSKGVKLFRELVLSPKTLKVNIGEAETVYQQRSKVIYFLNSAGTGLDSEIVSKTNDAVFRKKLKKWRLHRVHYAAGFIYILKKFKYSLLEVDIEGRRVKFKSFTLAVITNHPYFGKGMKIAPASKLKSMRFTIVLIEPLAKWKLGLLFATVFTGLHTKLKKVHILKGSSIKIKSSSGLLLQMDGQIYKCDKCTIRKTRQPRVFLTD
ncbi:diacylglycerol kinase family protein [Halobacillus sp. A5]|uniref:diacylglycerol/lipid kinase family protein n=1 Tax=Halobacillus sp. A5 TaxID=2880263 RepID=UPI0020A625FC|nr:YegS/Rv2252/BmrU family lipid kinase [Halobacillus sp. A5]MCP3025333.1 YegS/Rv2252/BmrU family lipid kinase [Halobacillus sp. A5]